MLNQQLYIGELAKRVGINPKTIRYYEGIGLLPPAPRTDTNYRIYRPEDVKRLEFIKKAQVLGLSLAEIKEILEIRESGRIPCEHVQALLTHKLVELDRHIAQMRSFRRELAEYLAELEARSHTGREEAICPHIEGFPGTIKVASPERKRD
jgi:DNA-binding transcriptional MerR regulator